MGQKIRSWSVRHARGLKVIHAGIESLLLKAHPLFKWLGYARLEKPFVAMEKVTKGFLFDSRACGQCILSATGMSCPMNCPKSLRNGPCGGVRPDGRCEIEPQMTCVWVLAWEGNQRLGKSDYPIQRVQPPVDNRLTGTSAWLREVRLKAANSGSDPGHDHEI